MVTDWRGVGGSVVNYTLARMQQLFTRCVLIFFIRSLMGFIRSCYFLDRDINMGDAHATRVVFVWIIRTEGPSVYSSDYWQQS